jgi:hypothetical protein
MTQRELNRAVAAATGESVETIAGLRFQLIDMPDDIDADIFRSPLVVDWDEVELRRAA